jgi:hypothetical protein
MRRRKDTKAAIVDVHEARAVCVRGSTLDSRVASLNWECGCDQEGKGAWWCLVGASCLYCAYDATIVALHAHYAPLLARFSHLPAHLARWDKEGETRPKTQRHWHAGCCRWHADMAGEGGRGDNQRGRRAPSLLSLAVLQLRRKADNKTPSGDFFWAKSGEKNRLFFLYFGFWSYKPKIFFQRPPPVVSTLLEQHALLVKGAARFLCQSHAGPPSPPAAKCLCQAHHAGSSRGGAALLFAM